jgi:signal transduction histidine kinase
VDELRRLLPLDRTSITSIDEAGERWSIVRQWTVVEPTLKPGATAPLAGSVFGEVVRTGLPVVESPIDPDGRWMESAMLRAEGMQSRIILPLLVNDRVTGTVSFASRVPAAFTEADLDLVVPMAAHLALAVENVRLYAAEREYAAGLEQRVSERTVELERANRELEAFGYSVSHDLRAPLRAMEGFSTALLSHHQDQLDEKGRHYLERIQQASQRMGQLINDMLNLSRITRADLNVQPVDLTHLARKIAAELQARDPERKVEFAIADRMIVQGDEPLLRIALENLLDNAWKFTGTRPRARIEVGQLTPAEFATREGDWEAHIGLPVRPHPTTPVFYVSDSGVGFDMAYAGRLFAPFQRLHAVHEFPGTGIGLAIVQRVIARHNGEIWAHARLAHGATFCFTLGGAR